MAKKAKMIRNLQDLIDHFGATDARNLNRRIYKDTGCGASISVRRPTGEWIHNGEWEKWDVVKEIDAFTIQTIIEGSEATVDSDTFVLPVRKTDVDHWIEEMEAEAARLWKEANEEQEEDDDDEGRDFEVADTEGATPEPYQGPKTVTIDAALAMRLFMEWHRDEHTATAQVRDYAHRLMTRLHDEAATKKRK